MDDTPESVHREIESEQRTPYGVRRAVARNPIIGALWFCLVCTYTWKRTRIYKEDCPWCGSYHNRRARPEDK